MKPVMSRPACLWLALGLFAAVLLMVMAWVSLTTLRLDRLQTRASQAADLEERARLALWRMDSWLASLVIEESARGYADYEAFAEAPRAYSRSFAQLAQGDVRVPSPLLGLVSSNILLHFQLQPDGRVTSPQVPTGHQRDLAESGYLSVGQIETATQRLARLRQILAEPARLAATGAAVSSSSPGLLASAGDNNADLLVRETLRPLDLVPVPFPVQPAEGPTQPDHAPAPFGQPVWVTQLPAAGVAQQFRNEAEFNYRANTFQQAQQRLSVQNALQQSESPQRPAPPPAAVSQGVFRALWLDDQLVLARRVDLGRDFVIQGCWLDWPHLRRALLDSIRDLFPDADLEPGSGRGGESNARRLATLPVTLLPGPVPSPFPAAWTPLRSALLVAWVCVLVTGLAVALLLRGTVSLSERRAAFVSAVTHELRTPLTTFRLYSEMLADGMVRDDTKRQSYLATLSAEATRLTHLVENVLAYARLERSRLGQRQERLALGDLLERVKPRLVERAVHAGLTLVDAVDEDARRVPVRVDVSVVEQILFNLVDNACKHGAPDATQKTVHLETLAADGRYAWLRVRDHGPGLTAEASRRLFRPFGKPAQAAAETAPGVGLGLALCRRLSRSLGGDLRLEPSVKDGAAFVLALPRAPR